MTSIGDTLFAYATGFGVSTVSVYDAQNVCLEKFKPAASNWPKSMSAVARLSPRHWIVRQGGLGKAIYDIPPVDLLTADSLYLGILSLNGPPDSATVTWLLPVVQGWSLTIPLSTGVVRVAPVNIPVRGGALHTLSGDAYWIVNPDNGLVVHLDSTGTLSSNDTIAIKRRPFDRKQIETAKTRAIADARSQLVKDLTVGRFSDKAVPELMPMFSAIFAGADGEIWLREFEVETTLPQRFFIVTKNGRLSATATIPAELLIQQIGLDYVLATKADTNGVQSIVEYSLKRN